MDKIRHNNSEFTFLGLPLTIISFFSLENYRSKVLSLVLLSYDVTDSLQTKIKRWTLLVIAVFSQTNSSNISAQLQAGKYVEEKSNFNVVYKEKETQFSCKKKKKHCCCTTHASSHTHGLLNTNWSKVKSNVKKFICKTLMFKMTSTKRQLLISSANCFFLQNTNKRKFAVE